jgi:hypothetical protein
MTLKKLVVLTDFTKASSMAAAHCMQLAALTKSEVIALHGITHDEDLEWAKKKTADQIRKVSNYDAAIPMQSVASSLNLFKGLKDWLEQQGAGLVFMATHGKKDVQFITGSNALKLIFNAATPFVVVQQNTPLRPYKHILLPVINPLHNMEFEESTLQSIVSLYQSRVTLLMPMAADDAERFPLERFAKRLAKALDGHAAEVVIATSDQPMKKFTKDVIARAADHVDLVAVIAGAKHHREEADKSKKFFQALITNEHGVPVLCV